MSLPPRASHRELPPVHHLCGSQQHSPGTGSIGHQIQAAVDPVGEIDVGAARRSEQRRIARRAARVAVRTGILALISVGLHLSEPHPDGPPSGGHRQFAAQQVRSELRGMGVKETVQI